MHGWAFTWPQYHMELNVSPPRSKAGEKDAIEASNSSKPVMFLGHIWSNFNRNTCIVLHQTKTAQCGGFWAYLSNLTYFRREQIKAKLKINNNLPCFTLSLPRETGECKSCFWQFYIFWMGT